MPSRTIFHRLVVETLEDRSLPTPLMVSPTAVNEEVQVRAGSEVTFIDVLADDSVAPSGSGPLTVVAVSTPDDGTAAVAPGGTGVTYAPDPQYVGPDFFTYTIRDALGNTATATVTVTVTTLSGPQVLVPESAPVVAANEEVQVRAGSEVTFIDVLADDSVGPGGSGPLTVVAVSTATEGTVAVAPGGTGVTYAPDPQYVGPDFFTYTIRDALGNTATATVTVTVSAPAPVAPEPSVPDVLAIGQSAGSPGPLRLYDASTHLMTLSVNAFPGFRGAVNVTTGDVNGDGVPDLIAAAGAGGNSHVEVLDGATGAVLLSFYAYPGFNGTVDVAAGDVSGTGKADIITSADGHLKVFDGTTGALLRSFFAFPGYGGEVTVAAADVDGDHIADVIAGAGAGVVGGPVKVFSGATGAVLLSFYAYPGFAGGVRVSAGALDGTGLAEIITGTLTGPPHVKVFDATGALVASFYAFDPTQANPVGGVQVVAVGASGDGQADLVTAALVGPTVTVSTLLFHTFGGPGLAPLGDPFDLSAFSDVDIG